MFKSKLKAKIVHVSDLTNNDKKTMFNIFEKYYANISYAGFLSDLNKKNKAIILVERKSNTIKGFSTILDLKFQVNGKEVKGLFSGDTIVEKEFWGGMSLQLAFTIYMIKEKLKNPFKKHYWFLISKGYKTYLLMAKNCPIHYPKVGMKTPQHEKLIIDTFGKTMYPEHYNPDKGLIEFISAHDQLKDEVAPITNKMLENEMIRFFVQKNPHWSRGDELVCLADFGPSILFNFVSRRFKKLVVKNAGNLLLEFKRTTINIVKKS
jgi:hypothetical protein